MNFTVITKDDTFYDGNVVSVNHREKNQIKKPTRHYFTFEVRLRDHDLSKGQPVTIMASPDDYELDSNDPFAEVFAEVRGIIGDSTVEITSDPQISGSKIEDVVEASDHFVR